jgi:hypothetical protein
MNAGGFKLFVDLPSFLNAFPKVVQGATVAAHKEAITTWRDRPAFPGLAYRFTWKASKDYAFSMRRRKYGSPTLLRVNYAKAGIGMPSEAMPGRKRTGLSAGSNAAPNRDKPWFFQSGGTKSRILQKRVTSRVYGGEIVSRFNAGGFGINLLGGQNHHGVATAHWVHIPVTYQMKVYKDSVAKTGAYTMTVTRGIARWVHSYASRSYRQEFEDLTHDLPWIKRLAEASLRNNLRDIVINDKGQPRLKFRRAVAKLGLDPAELELIKGGA